MKPSFCPRCRLRIRAGLRNCVQCNYRIPSRILRDRSEAYQEERMILFRDRLSL
jgi:hypothetical protein